MKIIMKTYFFPNPENEEAFFGSGYPVCVDAEELSRLAREWGITWDEMMKQTHTANEFEISNYGTYSAK